MALIIKLFAISSRNHWDRNCLKLKNRGNCQKKKENIQGKIAGPKIKIRRVTVNYQILPNPKREKYPLTKTNLSTPVTKHPKIADRNPLSKKILQENLQCQEKQVNPAPKNERKTLWPAPNYTPTMTNKKDQLSSQKVPKADWCTRGPNPQLSGNVDVIDICIMIKIIKWKPRIKIREKKK